MQLRDGDFAAVDDLEFMYVFNLGGTLTESSNYDAAPPVPRPTASGGRSAPGRFEARYEFYPTRAAGCAGDDLTAGGGWLAAGRGIFSETITVADDGEALVDGPATRPSRRRRSGRGRAPAA